ncbi:MAG TPA: sigma-70 family RNA polymerase sigma factor [Chthonomonadaceae bacterium]|nr:sigma-70 family RNA polymerase sigma factor [Chthonomonadaceae bacterium]
MERIARAQQGDRAAFAELCALYDRLVRSWIVRYLWGTTSFRIQESEDLALEVWLKLYSNLDTLRDPTGFEAYLHRLTRRVVIDHWRKQGRREHNSLQPETETGNTPMERLPAPTAGVEETVLNKLIREQWWVLLTPQERVAVMMDIYEGASHKQIGEELQLSKDQIYRLFKRVYGLLRRLDGE